MVVGVRAGGRGLSDVAGVVGALVRFGHSTGPRTRSVVFAGGKPPGDDPDPFLPGFLSDLDERTELTRRLKRLPDRERLLLFLWYIEGTPVTSISGTLGLSRAHCYRLRNQALRTLASDAPTSSLAEA